jgi:hypothetical protein
VDGARTVGDVGDDFLLRGGTTRLACQKLGVLGDPASGASRQAGNDGAFAVGDELEQLGLDGFQIRKGLEPLRALTQFSYGWRSPCCHRPSG